jgi:hypothetical protein
MINVYGDYTVKVMKQLTGFSEFETSQIAHLQLSGLVVDPPCEYIVWPKDRINTADAQKLFNLIGRCETHRSFMDSRVLFWSIKLTRLQAAETNVHLQVSYY